MKYIDSLKKAIPVVYAHKKYYALTGFFALAVMAFNVLITNYSLIWSQFSFSLVSVMFFSGLAGLPKFTLIILLIVAILGGMVLSCSVFLISRQIKGSVGASTSILVGIIAPSCPACAIGPLSALGLGGYLAVLPFRGMELGVLGVALLGVSLVYLSGKIVTTACEVKK